MADIANWPQNSDPIEPRYDFTVFLPLFHHSFLPCSLPLFYLLSLHSICYAANNLWWNPTGHKDNFFLSLSLAMLVAQSCLTLLWPHGTNVAFQALLSMESIFQARILKRVAIRFSRGSSRPRNGTWVSCIAGRFFTVWATKDTEIQKPLVKLRT